MNEIFGRLDASELRLGVVVSRFNEFITKHLLDGALDCWIRHGGSGDLVTAVWVPGAFEIPFAAKNLAISDTCDAIICLAAVIRGSTPHFDYVAGETAKGIGRVSLDSDIPVIFGVLTTDTVEQAIERAGTKAGNKGWTAALSAIEMARLRENLSL